MFGVRLLGYHGTWAFTLFRYVSTPQSASMSINQWSVCASYLAFGSSRNELPNRNVQSPLNRLRWPGRRAGRLAVDSSADDIDGALIVRIATRNSTRRR